MAAKDRETVGFWLKKRGMAVRIPHSLDVEPLAPFNREQALCLISKENNLHNTRVEDS